MIKRKPNCGICGTLKKLIGNGRLICPECSRKSSIEYYHKTKGTKLVSEQQKENKKKSNLKWKHTVRRSGFTNQQVAVIKNRYNVTELQLINFLKAQNGNCAICIKKLDKEFLIDHCHNSDKVRGLLCRDCNFAIGLFKDNINTLKNAIQYLSNK